MNQVQPKYNFKTASLKDVIFFYESICATSTIQPDIMVFNSKYKQRLKDKHCIQLLLEVDGKQAVGCVLAEVREQLSDANPYVEIQELYIFPKFRKLKAADFLYTALEEKVRELKIYQLRVNCNINSTLNQNFYVKKGFKISKKQYKKEAF